MAIQLSENADAKLLNVRVSGKLTAEDYGHFEPAVEALIGQVGKIHILFVMHDFHGWEMGAVWEDIKFAAKHCSDISKIAMVGDSNWEKWMAMICKPFTLSTIKYFDASDESDAASWLSQE